MTDTQTLTPARQLAEANKARFPDESAEYRAARNALLVEEIELRRHIEQVASQRRALPSGGRLPQDFELAQVESGAPFGGKTISDREVVTELVRPPNWRNASWVRGIGHCAALHRGADRSVSDVLAV